MADAVHILSDTYSEYSCCR